MIHTSNRNRIYVAFKKESEAPENCSGCYCIKYVLIFFFYHPADFGMYHRTDGPDMSSP